MDEDIRDPAPFTYDVSEMLTGYSRVSLWRKVREGKIRTIQVGGSVFLNAEDVRRIEKERAALRIIIRANASVRKLGDTQAA